MPKLSKLSLLLRANKKIFANSSLKPMPKTDRDVMDYNAIKADSYNKMLVKKLKKVPAGRPVGTVGI